MHCKKSNPREGVVAKTAMWTFWTFTFCLGYLLAKVSF